MEREKGGNKKRERERESVCVREIVGGRETACVCVWERETSDWKEPAPPTMELTACRNDRCDVDSSAA